MVRTIALLLIVLMMVTPLWAQDAPTTHTVQAGENLFRLSLRYGVSMDALMAANNISNPNLIFAGQVLIIPSGAISTQATSSTQTTSNGLTSDPYDMRPAAGTPRDNACNPGGTMAGQCNTDFDWMCGWYVARFVNLVYLAGGTGTSLVHDSCKHLLPTEPLPQPLPCYLRTSGVEYVCDTMACIDVELEADGSLPEETAYVSTLTAVDSIALADVLTSVTNSACTFESTFP